jgi:hypothetical protein
MRRRCAGSLRAACGLYLSEPFVESCDLLAALPKLRQSVNELLSNLLEFTMLTR